jgi:hypothetical protein
MPIVPSTSKTYQESAILCLQMKLGLLKDKSSRKLAIAMACYVILALTGALLLDGMLRAAVLCFFAILAVKTWVHSRKDEELP